MILSGVFSGPIYWQKKEANQLLSLFPRYTISGGVLTNILCPLQCNYVLHSSKGKKRQNILLPSGERQGRPKGAPKNAYVPGDDSSHNWEGKPITRDSCKR